MGRLDGKFGLITGASGGIGSATARACAEEGAHVVMVDIDDDQGAALSATLVSEGYAVEYRHCDVKKSDEVTALFEAISAEHPRLDFAANIVGGSGPSDNARIELHEQLEAAWDETIELCLRTTLLCMKHELASMLRTGGGAIVNVSSAAGLHVTPYATSAYSAAKAGVAHLTRHAAVIYADRAIRVNAIAPGMVQTPKSLALRGEDLIREMTLGFHCIPGPTSPSDQANAIAWLCSQEAAMVTGHTLPVDGGWDAR